ncbi:MAG: Cof-type HAD-IIB family hydrolase [Eubacteriales bacterium]|nr:Cof-type HAD-IIB family hydrolase [Eubacteriales bacterium]
MKYQLFASDMDDTLFGNDLIISPANLAAARRLKQSGVRLSFVTGRMFDAALPHLKKIGADGPVVCCQGAVVMDSATRTLIHYQPLDRELSGEILRFAEENHTYGQYYSVDDYYFMRPCDESRLYEKLAQHAGIAVGRPLWQALDFAPAKILLMGPPPRIRALYDEALTRFAGRAEICISKPNYLEFSHPLANKGEGLRRVAAYFDIPMSRVAAIGDGINDIPLIRAAALGIAVGSAATELKACAGAVVAPCLEDGFAQAVDQYILTE